MTPVKYMFEQRGLVRVQLHDQNDIEDLATMALCEGALDYEDHGSAEVLVCPSTMSCCVLYSYNAVSFHAFLPTLLL